MVKITYIHHDDTERTVEAEPGISVMAAAVANLVPGIDADCGGACACATCHVYVAESWRDRVGAPAALELDMLEIVEMREPGSRLSCQIKMTEELDGLVVRTPLSQS